MSCIVVFCNVPNTWQAKKIAEALLEKHLASCINILSHCESMFKWNGQIEYRKEIPLIIKTNSANYLALQELIVKLHPDDTPEIIALPVEYGLPKYLEWIESNLKPSN